MPALSAARTVFLLVFCLSLSAMTAWIMPARAAESGEWATLSQGQVVVKQSPSAKNVAPSVEALILIAKPPEKVWPVVADPETLMAREPKVKSVKVLSKSAGKQNVAFSVLMTRLFPPFNYVLVQELSPPTLLRFHRLSGSFRDIQGAWRLSPADHGNKTILSYTLMLDVGPFIPRGLLMAAVKSDLPAMMRNVKASIDANTH